MASPQSSGMPDAEPIAAEAVEVKTQADDTSAQDRQSNRSNQSNQSQAIEPAMDEEDQVMAEQVEDEGQEKDSDEDGGPESHMAYAMLQFPDAKFLMKSPALVIGRDMKAFRTAKAVFGDHGERLKSASLASSDGEGGDGSRHVEKSRVKFALYSGPDGPPFLAVHESKKVGVHMPSGSNISREHLKMEYNTHSGHFVATVLGRNGLFVNKEYFPKSERVALRHADTVQIGGIVFIFNLPGGAADSDDGSDDPASASASGRMSFAFEDQHGESVIADVETDLESSIASYQREEDDFAHHLYYSTNEDEEVEDDEDGQGIESGSEEDDEEADEEEGDEDVDAAPRLKLTYTRGQKHRHPPTLGKGSLTKTNGTIGHTHNKKHKKHEKAEKVNGKTVSVKHKAKIAAAAELEEDEQDPEKSKLQAAQRVARDEPLQNGDGIEVVGLPVGVIIPPRRKGPGRPPKDGIMSKREKSLLIRQYREQEKAKKLGLDPALVTYPEPKKASRLQKPANGDEAGEDGENGTNDDQEKKSKVSKPPKSPSPELKEEDFTPEQLAKPTAGYVVYCYDAIMASTEKRLNLQQIYSAIERKYPYFMFKAPSNGWQSSVRHNLSQHPAFRKVARDGKGWLWGVVEGVSIDKERKKKSPPPPSLPYPPYRPPSSQNGSYGMSIQYGAQTQQPPSRQSLVPPSLAPSSGPRRQSYSSPYATNKQHQANQANQAHHPMHQPAHQRQPLEKASATSTPSGNTARSAVSILQTSFPPSNRPANDVIETFISVFIKQISSGSNSSMDTATAERVVNNAIKRVLEPQTMVKVPVEDQELKIIESFRKCVETSRGPPRQAVPSTTPLTTMTAMQARQSAMVSPSLRTGASTKSPPTGPRPQARPQSQIAQTLRTSSSASGKASSGTLTKRSEPHTQPTASVSRSPTRPAVEPLTPPPVGAKRSIGAVDDVETSPPKK